MKEISNIVPLRQPAEIDDPLTNILRAGARQLLAQAVEVEAEIFLAAMKDLKLADGRDRVVRHGHGPTRAIQTGIGPVEVERVKIRDRGAASDGERIRFTSAILPLWARRTKSLDALLPVLYLRGISTGDFQPALAALLGQDAPNLSPAVISRLTAEWHGEYERWQKRDLSARRYVYVWADGVFLQARMEDHGECMLVLIGATPEGRKELIGFQVGVRESTQSWRELLIDVKQRGLQSSPEIAVGDGALGFWKALDEVFPGTRHQRCWVHKTVNVLNKVALSVQANMKKDLREVCWAPGRAAAKAAIDVFAEKYGAKYGKAVECLTKDSEALLAFYDFPAEHWDHRARAFFDETIRFTKGVEPAKKADNSTDENRQNGQETKDDPGEDPAIKPRSVDLPPPLPPKRKDVIMAGERELTAGLLAKGASFRLIVSGEIGVKDEAAN